MDKNKADLVPIKRSLPSASTGGRKILSTVMADALAIAKEKQLGKNVDLSITELDVSSENLTELDLSRYPNLETLDCSANELTKLDLSHTPELTQLWCYENQLTELDLSHTPELTKLQCSNNLFSPDDLDLSHIKNLQGTYF